MKTILIIIFIVIAVILIGTFPLSLLSKALGAISDCLQWLADALNFFGWNGIL